MENLTRLKICSWASPEIKYDLIKAFPLDHSHIFMCVCENVCVRVCVCVCMFQTTKWCHTGFWQPCVLSTTESLSFINEEEARVWGVTFPRPTALTYTPGLLTHMAAGLFPFHALKLKGLQIPQRWLFASTSFLKEFNTPYCLELYHEGLQWYSMVGSCSFFVVVVVFCFFCFCFCFCFFTMG